MYGYDGMPCEACGSTDTILTAGQRLECLNPHCQYDAAIMEHDAPYEVCTASDDKTIDNVSWRKEGMKLCPFPDRVLMNTAYDYGSWGGWQGGA